AYRRPLNAEDMEGLMTFFDKGRAKEGNFEGGIRTALQAMLASLDFVFKFEKTPTGLRPGDTFRLSDLELASRLSYLQLNTMPDDQLVSIAGHGKLRDPLVLESQVRRMLTDKRSESLSTKFAGQWLHLQDLEGLNPDGFYYPNYDHTLAMGLKRET